MRFLRQSMFGLFLAAVALGLLVFAGQMIGSALSVRLADEERAPPPRERVFAVNVTRAELEDVTPVLQSFGEIRSRRSLELRAAVPGRVIELAETFEEGGRVEAGSVLLRIDPLDAQAALDRAQSDLADAAAEGREAGRALALARDELAAAEEQAALRERALARQRDLGTRGVGTTAASETAELAAAAARQAVLSRAQALAQGEARVDRAETLATRAEIALAEAERRRADTVLRAPFDGILSAPNVVVGGLVSGNERLAELIDPSALEVSFRLSTTQFARLLDENGTLRRADLRATLDVAGLDLVARGQISRVAATTGEGASGRLVFAELKDAPGFRPGDFVTVTLREPELAGVIRLPAAALDASGDVLVLGEDDRLEAVAVELLRRQGDTVLVRGPIAGRDVVEARSPLLGAGIRVRPLRGAEAAVETGLPTMIEISEAHRARLVALVEGNNRMPVAAKARVLAQLAEPLVPARIIERIESRMGG